MSHHTANKDVVVERKQTPVMNETKALNGTKPAGAVDIKILSMHKPELNYVSPPEEVYVRGIKIKMRDLSYDEGSGN